jgi:hypothetical protein
MLTGTEEEEEEEEDDHVFLFSICENMVLQNTPILYTHPVLLPHSLNHI